MTSPADFSQMNPDEFAAWQRSFHSGVPVEGQTTFPQPEGAQLPGAPESVPPPPSPPQARPASEVWGADQTYDYVAPSGAQCRLRRLKPEKLIETGLLDRMTRLPGFAQELIDKADGKPPVKPASEMEAIKSVLTVLQELLPLVVAEPTVYSDPSDDGNRQEGLIYVSSIELNDRLAIMNQVMAGVVKMDSFRPES